MAIDTRDKRASLIGLGLPVPRLHPSLTGGLIGESIRRFLAFLYSGFDGVNDARQLALFVSHTASVPFSVAHTAAVSLSVAHTASIRLKVTRGMV